MISSFTQCILSLMCSSLQQLLPHDVQYSSCGIYSDEQLEMAVKNSSYPPTIECFVKYRKELKRTGRPTEVTLHISGMDRKMEFPCPTYEQKPGDWNMVWTYFVTAPTSAPFVFQPSSKRIMPEWCSRVLITIWFIVKVLCPANEIWPELPKNSIA